MGTPTALPARILLQIREGVPNLLADFDLVSHRETILDEPNEHGGMREHKVATSDIISGLAVAMRNQIKDQRSGRPDADGFERWLDELIEWIIAPSDEGGEG